MSLPRKKAVEQLKKLEKSIELLKKDISHSETLLEHFETEKDNIKDLKQSFEEEKERKLSRTQSSIIEKQKDLTELSDKLKSEREKEITEKNIEDLKKEWEELKEVQAKITVEISSIDEKKSQAERFEYDISNKKRRISTIQEKIKELENPKDTACPTCGTILEKADKNHFAKAIHEKQEDIKEIEREIDDFEDAKSKIVIKSLESLQKDYKEVFAGLEEISEEKESLENVILNDNRLADSIKMVTESIESLKFEKEEIEKETGNHFLKKIKEVEEREEKEKSTLDKNMKGLKVQTKECNDLEILKGAFKEVRQYIFGNLLAELTRKTNVYLSQLFELPIKIKFSVDTSTRTPKIVCSVTLDGKERTLGLYSGGQFRRIQLAVDLALSEIVSSRSDCDFSLRILDEYFKDLSDVSMQKVLKLVIGL